MCVTAAKHKSNFCSQFKTHTHTPVTIVEVNVCMLAISVPTVKWLISCLAGRLPSCLLGLHHSLTSLFKHMPWLSEPL